MVEKRYGQPEMAEKHKKSVTQVGGSSRVRRPDPGRPATIGHEILWPRSSGGGAPPCPAREQ